MGAAAVASGRDSERIRELLAHARGYAVLEVEGRRVGAFIGLSGSDGQQIAIRHDGVLLWRRRVLPTTTVARVLRDQRAVILNVDRGVVGGTKPVPTAPGTADSAEELAHSNREWQERISRYLSSDESGADRATGDRAGAEDEPAAETGELEPPVASASQVRPDPADRSEARHLLFVSTSRGYALIDRDGPPPSVGRGIDVPEQPGAFLVAKLGPSPLPDDPRICAYLEHTE